MEEPCKIISRLDTTAANYPIAWNLMIHNHIKGIFEQPVIMKESHVLLRQLSDAINNHLLSLKTLGEEIDKLTQKFEDTTCGAWESFKIADKLPKMEDMHNFLNERCQILETNSY